MLEVTDIQQHNTRDIPSIKKAVVALQRIHKQCGSKAESLDSLSKLLSDKLFQQLLTLEHALAKVKKEINDNPNNFPDYTLDKTGQLKELNPKSTKSTESTDERSSAYDIPDDGWLNDFIDKMANGREVEHITLKKTTDTSLGFSVVGLESDNRGELGIFVQDIQADTIADIDGRLKESDQILVINGKPLGLNVSHREAIAALQAVKDVVKLIVARGPIPRQTTTIGRSESATSYGLKHTERRWAHKEVITLRNEGEGFGVGIVGGKATGVSIKTVLADGPAERDGRIKSGDSILKINGIDLNGMGSEQAAILLKETGNEVEIEIARGELPQYDHRFLANNEEIYEVELTKDESGIGIHIAGYVNGSEGGIHVKAITPNSPASRNGQIREGDQIIAVNGLKLDGPNVGSEEAVMALQNTGDTVHLTLNRPILSQFPILTEKEMKKLKNYWERILGDDHEVIVCHVNKEHPSEPFGFDIEGSFDSENRSQHIIRKISAVGPIARSQKIRPGDRLLEVNGRTLMEMDPEKTIECLKGLPENVFFVVARNLAEEEPEVDDIQINLGHSVSSSLVDHFDDSKNFSDSEYNKELIETVVDVSSKPHVGNSRLEDLEDESNIENNMDNIDWIELEKGPNGLGFSILDTKDESGHYTKIRGLVSGGVAEQQGQLKREDKLIYVNEFHFDMKNYTLQDCVSTLKSLPSGLVRLGVIHKDDDQSDDEIINASFAGSLNENISRTEEYPGQILTVIQHPTKVVASQRPQINTIVKNENVSSLLPPESSIADPADLSRENSMNETLPIFYKPEIIFEKVDDQDNTDKGSIFSDATESLADTTLSQPINTSNDNLPMMDHSEPLSDQVSVNRVDSLCDIREVRSITINKGNASLGITVSPDSLGRGLVIRSVISNGAVARDGTLEAGDIITSVNGSDVAGLHTDKARQLIRHHSFHSTKVILSYLPSTDKLSGENSGLHKLERVPSSAGFSDTYTKTHAEESQNNLWFQPKTVQIHPSGAASLGLSIVDRADMFCDLDLPNGTYVKSVDPGSPAERSGLKFGDRIVTVNGEDTSTASHQAVIRLLREHKDDILQLNIESLPTQEGGSTTSSSLTNSEVLIGTSDKLHKSSKEYTVEIKKSPGKGLGLSLVGKRLEGKTGIFVVSVTPDGPTDKDGRVLVGDEVTAINGTKLSGKTQQETLNLIKESTETVKITLTRQPHESYMKNGQSDPTVSRSSSLLLENKLDKSGIRISKREVKSCEIIKLVKDFSGLGFSLEDSQSGVRVRSLTSNGPASRDGRLMVDDRILIVNEQNVYKASYRDVTDILKAAKGTIELIVQHSNNKRRSSGKPTGLRESDIAYGQETEIEITKGSSGLGLSITGGSETVLGCVLVHEVYPGSEAYTDGRLQAGDRILAVNGIDITGLSHNQASDVLRKADGVVRLRIIRDGGQDELEVVRVRLNKIPGQGLGLNIENSSSGVIIYGIVPNSEAAIDGTLQHGDVILSANGKDLKSSTREEVAQELRNSCGHIQLEVGRRNKSNNDVQRSDSNVRRCIIKRRYVTEPLGISIAGGHGSGLGDVPIFIAAVDENGPANRVLKVGERIVSINGQSAGGITHTQCANMFRTPNLDVQLEVAPGDQEMQYVSEYLFAQTEKNKKSSNTPAHQNALVDVVLQRGVDGLGFSIVGGKSSPKGDLPIYIKTVSGGAAARSGKLKRGDQIIAVNGTPLDDSSRQDTVELLKSLQGQIILTIIPA